MGSADLRYVETQLHKDIVHWVENGFPPILVVIGPPGTGKTTAVQQVCIEYATRYSHEIIPAVRGAHLSDFFGVWAMKSGETEFRPGPLYNSLKRKNRIIVIDDAHTVAPDLQLFNSLGDGTGRVSCAELGVTLTAAAGVRLILIANPPSNDLPSWERSQWEIPDQIMSRARVLRLEKGLSEEDERQILSAAWEDLKLPDRYTDEHREGLYEVVVHLRSTPALGSYVPSLRDMLLMFHLLAQGLPLADAFLQSVGFKPPSADGREAAWAAFQAKFPTERAEEVT